MTDTRRGLIAGGAAALTLGLTPQIARAETCSPPPSPRPRPGYRLLLNGQSRQGGFALGRTTGEAPVFVDGVELAQASANGLFVVGFDRDASPTTTIKVGLGQSVSRTLDIAPGTFPSSRIDGLPPATVEPSDPDLLARIQRELAAKTAAFASCADTEYFADGFVWPLETYRVSSLWGAQRILNGTPARPHYGIDLAAPQGTPIHAPAPGLVVFAEPDMHFEGGLVLIDHGQGLITAYLHQSRIDVTPGQRLARGDAIGLVGMKGRATGPHLCWRMKWRDRNLDPSLMVGALAPQA